MRRRSTAVTGAVLVLLAPASRAQDPNSEPPPPPASDESAQVEADAAPAAEAAVEGTLIPELPDYSGDWKSRKFLLGDWNGARTDLAEKGLLFELTLDQNLSGNVHGGNDTNNAARYSGSWDLRLKLDTARMGLWPGGLLELHAESQFGDFVNDEVGGLSNVDALFPLPGYRDITLSHVSYTQAFSEHFGVFLGKLDTTVGDRNEFAWIHGDNFLNTALTLNPVVLRTVPYSALGAGVFVTGDWGMWTLSVIDAEGTPKTTGFDTVFDGGTTVASEVRFNVEPFGKPGHQLLGGTWSDKVYFSLDQDPRLGLRLIDSDLLRLALRSRRPDRESGSWSFYYNFDQYLYVEEDDPEQGIGIFGRFGVSDGEANAVETFYSIGVGGQGIIPERDRDKFGLGYYFVGYGGNLLDRIGIRDTQGVELFYDIEVTPWMHVTPDLQVIVNPGGDASRDVAIVYGLHCRMSF